MSETRDANPPTPYAHLCDAARERALLTSIMATLDWDQETGLPAKASDFRSRQISWLAAKHHELATRPDLQKWLSESSPADDFASANIREWQRDWQRANAIPPALVEEEALLCSQSKSAWVKARKNNDFSAFLPWLEKLVALNRKKAHLWGFANEPYDALLDTHERGATAQSIQALFSSLAPPLSALAAQAAARTSACPDPFPYDAIYSQSQQEDFNRTVAKSIGFDFDAGRIDTTSHPFCTKLGPFDVRLTTRYQTDDFRSSLFGVLHEAGHGLYEQGLPNDQFGLPAGEAISLGFHESQSRLWENHVGRSPQFWNRFYPLAQQSFPPLQRLAPDDFLAALRRSMPSLIRVEADELTYDLHIIMRFELERAMINGDLAPADLPQAWNQRTRELFGLVVPDDSQGCLQDIHWAMGAFGYFPTYTIGNITAACLMETAMASPAISDAFNLGDFTPLLAWLRQNVHARGSAFLPAQLVETITGSPLRTEPYLRHLASRYALN